MNRRRFFHKAVGLVGGVLFLPVSAPRTGSGGQEAGSEGARYHQRSGIRMERLREPTVKPSRPYIGRKSRTKPLKLPGARMGDMTVQQALRARRSRRDYSGNALGLPEISALLFAAQGITKEDSSWRFRTAPSAGALYPFDIYLFAHDISQLDPGIYLYNVRSHELAQHREGDFRRSLSEACLFQRMVSQASLVIVMAAVFARTTKKYGDRGYRYVYIEAGCISQNIYLAAESMGLGTVAVGAFFDDRLNTLIGLDGAREAAVLVQPVGKI